MSESPQPAMEVSGHEPCPVMRAWSKSSVVVQQLLKGKLVVLQYNTLGRPAVSDNVELLAPLIDAIGASTAYILYTSACTECSYNTVRKYKVYDPRCQ